MNKQQKLTFLTCLQLCLKVILIVLLFVDGMFVIETVTNDYTNYITRAEDYPQSCFKMLIGTPEPDYDFGKLYENNPNLSRGGAYSLNGSGAPLIAIIVFVFLLFDIVIDLLKLFSTKFNQKKWVFLLPIMTFIMFVLMSIMHTYDYSELTIDTRTSFSDSIPYKDFSANVVLGAWFYVALIIFLAVVVISLYNMVMSDKKLSEKASQFSFKLKKNESVPEQLEKYKELLENNIITEEEFEAKKKQLLDL